MRILSVAIVSTVLALALPLGSAQACHRRCEASQTCEPRHHLFERHHERRSGGLFHHHRHHERLAHHDRCRHHDRACKAAHTGDGSG